MNTPPENIPKFNVLGVGVSALNLTQARDLLLGVHGALRRGYVCVTGVHGVTEAGDDAMFRGILNRAWLVTPDGMPLVWIGRARGHGAMTRVYGPDLMLVVCDAGRASGLTHYFYGGGPDVAETLKEKLAARFPGLQVVGTFSPPFRALEPEESATWRAEIARVRPDVIWVGLSTPKQERFMAELAGELDAGVLVGVGAAFDFHAGLKRQAPRWMQRSGLEWLFRLCTEPRRLGARYLRNNPLFLARLLLQATGLRKYPLE